MSGDKVSGLLVGWLGPKEQPVTGNSHALSSSSSAPPHKQSNITEKTRLYKRNKWQREQKQKLSWHNYLEADVSLLGCLGLQLWYCHGHVRQLENVASEREKNSRLQMYISRVSRQKSHILSFCDKKKARLDIFATKILIMQMKIHPVWK